MNKRSVCCWKGTNSNPSEELFPISGEMAMIDKKIISIEQHSIHQSIDELPPNLSLKIQQLVDEMFLKELGLTNQESPLKPLTINTLRDVEKLIKKL